jgi:hypothetical protein
MLVQRAREFRRSIFDDVSAAGMLHRPFASFGEQNVVSGVSLPKCVGTLKSTCS